MSGEDFIIESFWRIEDKMHGVYKHRQANLYPSEIVTLAFLLDLKGVSERASYSWIERD